MTPFANIIAATPTATTATYTNKQVAGAQGTGKPQFTSELPVLLREAVVANMDNFLYQLQSHFDDCIENGREVVIEVGVFDNGSGDDLETEYDGYEFLNMADEMYIGLTARSNTFNGVKSIEKTIPNEKETIKSDNIDLKDSLDTLTEEEKQIINYRYYKDFTQSETARILGMSQVTVSRYEKKSLTKMYNYLSI